MENIAAIDIGSNAIRFVIGEFDEHSHTLRLLRKLREPVRLGKDVFAFGEVSQKSIQQAVTVFSRFRELADAYKVKNLRAVATSALREAQNKDYFVKKVKSGAGIHIQVIDGEEEARLIHAAVASQVNLTRKLAVLVDVGGGSVEVTVSFNGKIRATQSYGLGGVRILQKMEELKIKEKHLKAWLPEQMSPIFSFIEQHCRGSKVDLCVGTGGNLEYLGKLRVQMLDKDSTFSLRPKELEQITDQLMSLPIRERITRWGMRSDRADVIVPAAIVVQAILNYSGTHRLLIPAVGLKDGVLVDLVHSKGK